MASSTLFRFRRLEVLLPCGYWETESISRPGSGAGEHRAVRAERIAGPVEVHLIAPATERDQLDEAPSWIGSLSKKYLKQAVPGPLAEYLRTPFVSADRTLDPIEFLALDIEATGQDVQRDEILSAGFTVIRKMSVILAESQYFLVRPKQPIPEHSAIIHRIFDDASAQGVELEVALSAILKALHGRVLLAHHANIECGFLNMACQQVFGSGIVFPLVDTFAIEYKSLKRRGVTPYNQSMRLASLREDYHLPRYPAHNALSDAVATAELSMSY